MGNASHYNTFAAVELALAELGGTHPLFLFALVGGRHAGASVLEKLAKLYPGVPIAGGSVVGTITDDKADCAGFTISIMAFFNPNIVPRVFRSAPHDAVGDHDRAYKLGREIAVQCPSARAVLLLYDSVARTNPFKLHAGSFIASGFQQGLGEIPIKFVGAGLITSPNMDDSWLLSSGVHKHAIVALVFPPQIVLDSFVLAGSRPTGLIAQITSIDGAEIAELNGRPAYLVICEALGRDPQPAENVLALNVSLGESQRPSAMGRSFSRNRLILAENRDRGTITLFEPDFQRGDYVEIFLQDGDYMLQEASRAGARQRGSAHGRKFAFCVYFSCAGRSSALTGLLEDEALVLMKALPPTWAKIGGYTGVEIADVEGRCRALDLTGVLAVFRIE